MFPAVPGPVEPPDLPRRRSGRQRVKHREHGGGTDAGAQENDGALARREREVAPWRARVHDLADLQLFVDVGPGGATGFALDAHAIMLGAGLAGHGVAARQHRCAGRRLQPQHDELAGQGCRQGVPVDGLEHQRDHVAALANLARHPQRAQSRPRRKPAGCRCQTRVSGRRTAPLLVQERLQGGAPTGAQRRDAQRALQLVTRVPGLVEQRVDLGHAHALRACGDQHDLVAGLHLALLQDAEVETGPAVCDEQCRHPRLVHADAHAVAGDARLGHFEQGATHAVAIADADFLVGQAVDGEILSELSVGEVVSVELALPVAVGLRLIDEDGAVLTPVSGQIPLAVAVDVEPPHHAWARN